MKTRAEIETELQETKADMTRILHETELLTTENMELRDRLLKVIDALAPLVASAEKIAAKPALVSSNSFFPSWFLGLLDLKDRRPELIVISSRLSKIIKDLR